MTILHVEFYSGDQSASKTQCYEYYMAHRAYRGYATTARQRTVFVLRWQTAEKKLWVLELSERHAMSPTATILTRVSPGRLSIYPPSQRGSIALFGVRVKDELQHLSLAHEISAQRQMAAVWVRPGNQQVDLTEQNESTEGSSALCKRDYRRTEECWLFLQSLDEPTIPLAAMPASICTQMC